MLHSKNSEMSSYEKIKISRPNTSEDEIFRMTNFTLEENGLDAHIWISPRSSVMGQHGPRIRVSQLYGRMSSTFSILIPQNATAESFLNLGRKQSISKALELSYTIIPL